MRNTRTLRYSLTSLTILVAALGAALVACGDDDDNANPPPGTPGTDSGPGADTGVGPARDAAAEAGPKKDGARLQLVNAVFDLGPGGGQGSPVQGALRICYGIGASADTAVISPLPPLPNRTVSEMQPFPGVFVGTGGPVQSTGLDLSKVAVVPYIMSALSLSSRGFVKRTDGKPDTSCADIFDPSKLDGGAPLVLGRDYWKMPAINPGTLLDEKSYILVLTGCSGNAGRTTQTSARCGTGYTVDGDGVNSNGNLTITVHEVDRGLVVAADKLGVQFVHASPAGDVNLKAASIPVVPGFQTSPEAGTGMTGFRGITGGVAIPLNTKSMFTQVAAPDASADSFTAAEPLGPLSFKLPLILTATYGAPNPAALAPGKAVTFVALGDPNVDAGPGGAKFHYLALPNNPEIVLFDSTK